MSLSDETRAADAEDDGSDDDVDPVADLCFRARALAQSHPMSETARRYRQDCHIRQRADQPVADFADWAVTALDVGYCLRRTEEDAVGRSGGVPGAGRHGRSTDQLPDPTGEMLGQRAQELATELRVGDADELSLLPAPLIVAALDRLIATELDKRADNVREQLDEADWSDLEAYISWWVVYGYCVRAAECEGFGGD